MRQHVDIALFICIQDREESEEFNSDHEPPKKVFKAPARLGSGSNSIKLLRVKEEAQILTDGDIQILYAIHVANQARQHVAAAAVSMDGAGSSS